MEFLAGLYTLLLVAICLLQALLLYRTGKPAARQDDEALKEWLRQQLEAQARVLEEKQAQQAQQNLAAMAHISDTLQTAVQGMSSTLAAGQNTQQQTMEQRLQGLEASNARKLEEMRKALADGLAAMQAQNAQKLDEIRHTVDEQLQDALQKRVTESFKAVNDQLEQVYKGLGEMQSLAADVGGLKQVLSGVKTRGILGEIQLGAILEEILAPEQYDTNVATIPGSTQRVEYAIKYARCGRQHVSGCPSTPSSPAIPTPTCRTPRLPAMHRPWRTPATRWNVVLRSEAKDIRDKYMWSRPIPQPSASCSCPLRAVCRGGERRSAGSFAAGLSGQHGGPQHHGGAAQQPADGLQDPCHPEALRRGLAAVGCGQDEFEKFGQGLSKMQQRLRQTDEDLDNLIGVRSRAISRKLRAVQTWMKTAPPPCWSWIPSRADR